MNGTYVLTAERLNGKPVYAKEGDADRWLYFATDKSWYVSPTASKEGNNPAGWGHTEVGLVHPAAAKEWTVVVDGQFVAQPVEVSIMVRVQPRFY